VICDLVNDIIVVMPLSFQNMISQTLYVILRWKNQSNVCGDGS